jgi:hypothetical protein
MRYNIMITIPLKLEVYHIDTDVETPSYLIAELTEEDLNLIHKISDIVNKNDLEYAATRNATPNYYVEDFDSHVEGTLEPFENYGGVELELLKVSKESFFWTGRIKNTDIDYYSESFALSDLIRLEKIANIMPIEEMPIFINDENWSIRLIAERRLNKGI